MKQLCFKFAEEFDLDSDRTELKAFERSSDVKSNNPHGENLDVEEPAISTPQQEVTKSTLVKEEEEDEEDSGTSLVLECMEWDLDSIELECLRELLMLQIKLKLTATEKSSLHNKFKEVKQKMTSMLETIKTLNTRQDNERMHLMELEKERDMLADRTKEHESNEKILIQTVEELKRQAIQLKDLAFGGKKQAIGSSGKSFCYSRPICRF